MGENDQPIDASMDADAQKALRESKELLQTTIDSSLDIIQVFKTLRDKDNKIIDFVWVMNNKQGVLQNGDVIGQRVLSKNPGMIESGIFDKMISVVETGTPVEHELHYRYEQFDGWFYQALVKSGDDGLVMTTRDITAQKKAETAIVESRNMLQAMMDAPNVGVSVFSAIRNTDGEIIDFRFDFVNKRTLEAFQGHDPTGTKLTDYAADGRAQLQYFKEAVASGKKNSYTRKATAGIVEGWFLFSNAPIDNDRLVQVWEDITELKKAEEEIKATKDAIVQRATDKYYSIFNSITEGFCIYELIYDDNGKPVDLRWIEVNPAYEKQTGLKDTVGKLHSDLALKTEDYWFEIYDNVVKTGEAIHFENWHESTGRWYSTFSSRIGEPGSKQVVVLFSDVTERKHQEQLKEYLLKLSDALRSLNDPMKIQETAAALLGKHLNASRAFYYEVETQGEDDIHVINNDYYLDNISSIAGRYRRKRPATNDLFGKLFQGETLVVNDIDKIDFLPPHEQQEHHAMSIQSYVTVPFIKGGKYVAGMNVQNAVPRKWTKAEILITEETAERTWAAVQRAKTEESLQKSEEKYRSIFNSIDEGFCLIETILNEKGEPVDELFLEMNPAYTKHTGLTEDIVGKRSSEIVPNREPAWLHFFGNVALTGKPNRIEYHVNGIDRWLSAYASKLGDKDSLKVAVVFNDITDRKHHEQQQDFLLKLSDAMRPLNSTIEVQKAAMKMLAEHFDVMRASYFEVQEDQDTFELTARYERDAIPIPNQMRLSDFSPDLANDCRSGRTLMVKETENEDLREAYRAIGVRAWLAVPLVKGGMLVAIVGVHSKTPRNWTEAEVRLIEDVAQRTWAAVERAKIEEALRESEERLQLSVKGANLFTWEVNPQTGQTKYSDNVHEVLGYEIDTVSSDNFINIHPADKEFVEASVRNAIAGEMPLDIQHRIINPVTKETLWVRAQGQLTKRLGSDSLMFIGVTQNITSAKLADDRLLQSEELYRIALNSADMAAWDWNIVNDTLQWNDQHFYNLGLNPENRLLEVAYFMSFLHPDDVTKVSGAIQTAINETGIFREEFRVVRADNGEVRWMSSYGKSISKENGKAARMVGVMYDITDRKRLEQQKEDFIGAASHELKTPVTSIKTYVEVLLEKMEMLGEEKDAALLTKLNTQIDRLANLIDYLLDTTRISEGKMVLNPEVVNIDELLRERTEEVTRTSNHIIDVEAASGETVKADPERIGQVITNLLSNAIKYSLPKTVIKVTSRTIGNSVEVSIRDHGYGISHEDQQKIFERFYRVTKNNMDTFPGMGLGLYISAQIIHLHGGTISVKSKPGDGSEFSFYLPISIR